MACRRLIFERDEIHWYCQCADWREDTTVEPTRAQELVSGASRLLDLISFNMMVLGYNTRHLTYDEDALPAISGMLAVFSRCFEGGFLYGLPEMFFDIAMAWQPPHRSLDLRRRKASSRPGKSSSLLPSWSWIGWHGATMGLPYEEGFQEAGGRQTHPITVWYASHTPDTKHNRPISSSWFSKRDKAQRCD